MPSAYPQRALTVLLLFGTLSAAMALLSSSLIFQLPSGRAAPAAGALPEPVAAAVLPVSAALAALCLVLNVSCLLLCLLHGYFSTELGRGQRGAERALWFLLDSRSVRHAAIGLFCCGVCLYLTALALSMLLLFQLEAGVASACILTSGILVLLLSLLHALLRASRISRISQISQGPEPPQALYENDSAQPGPAPAAAPRPCREIHREFSFPPSLERKSRPGSAASSNPSSGSKELPRDSQWELSRSKEFPKESQWELSRSKEFQCQDWSRNTEFPKESQWELSRSKELPRDSQWELSRSKEFPKESQWELSRSKEFPRESQWELSRSKEFPRESQWELSRSKEFQCQDWSRNTEFPKESHQDWSRNTEFPKESHQELSRSKELPRGSQSRDWSRTHGTLLDSGLLQEQGHPWNVTGRQMSNAMSHRATKDSTLV
ncbi:transmembrane protein 221 [Passerculus sandwichensis]